MVIRVLYNDGSFDMVKAERLDDMLPQGRITMFKRSTGWVSVGIDPIRGSKHGEYNGPERRESNIKANINVAV